MTLVVADIDAEGLLIAVEDKKVMQPFGDRSGVVIEPMLTDQWFVAADKLAEEAMAKVDDGSTKFIPENWKKTYDHWMKDIQPWCIDVTIARDPDVLDTWFSSGLWPFSTLGWPENTDELERFYPTSVVVTAFDIIFWAQYPPLC